MKENYKIINYPDGGSYVEILKPFTELTYRINSYKDLFLLRSIKEANPLLQEVTIPCLFQAQHDSKFADNQTLELKPVLDFINACNFKRVNVFHPHNKTAVEFGLNNSRVIDNYEFVNLVLDNISADFYETPNDITDKLIIFSTDAGSFKWINKLCDKLNWQGETYSASKARKYEDGKSKLVQVIERMDFKGKDILILDDLMVGGGTFVGLADMLKERNCGRLFLGVSHITISNPNPELFCLCNMVFTTNSKGISYTDMRTNQQPKNLEVINIF